MESAPPLVPSSLAVLSIAVASATETWHNELKILFEQAKSWYADVVWDMVDDDGRHTGEIWGHKVIIFARAPALLRTRYFPSGTISESPGPSPTQNLFPTQSPPPPFGVSQSPRSPLTSTSSATLFRIPLRIDPNLFRNELEFLYTGRGMNTAFESLLDTSAENGQTQRSTGETERRDKLRKDLVYMWRSRLYSDVQITLTGNFASNDSEVVTAVFSSHRFILAARVPYFRALLSTTLYMSPVGQNISSTNPLPLNLPAPPFTPASLHFTLGFVYTGTVAFSHRNWDLDTAFNVIRAAKYLGLDTLDNEARARIVAEMMHGLFHAYLPFEEYERVIEGKWGTGACKCKQCQRRAPRVLEFALRDDVRDIVLERGAQRALVGMYGEGWATSEFLALPLRLKNTLLKGVKYRTLPHNIIPLLRATQVGLNKLLSSSEPSAEAVRNLMLQEREKIDGVLCNNLRDFVELPEWVGLLESNAIGFGDTNKFDLVLESIRRGLTERNAGHIYQTLVSSVLLREGPTPDTTILSSNSPLRARVEKLRKKVLRWMKRHWTSVQMSGCLADLEGWALKEISDELSVPTEYTVPSSGPRSGIPRTGRTFLAPPKLDAKAKAMRIRSVDATNQPAHPASGVNTNSFNTVNAGLLVNDTTSRTRKMSTASDTSSSTVKPSSQQGSMVSVPPIPKLNELDQSASIPPIRGVSLYIGIPCVIISKAAVLKAFTRYIGEINGEQGPWVGVEIQVSESWGKDWLGEQYWNDGSIGGIRYFELNHGVRPWDDSDQYAMRRRRIESVLTQANQSKKRSTNTKGANHDHHLTHSASPDSADAFDTPMNESRGLFVRPLDVVYVLDSV